ncbi:MAG: hypothetical protein J1E97_03690 [Muribaculaceae bacterium]|nr:hypothetical protein [Muribaculaceae bacterium]
MATKENKKANSGVVENLDSHLTNAGRAVANNKRIIYIAVGVVAVVAAFVLSYLFIYRNPRLQNSWEAYNKVLMMQMTQQINDSVAALEYQKVSTNFSSTPAGNVAALASAEAFYNVKNYQAAAKVLEKLGLSEPILQAQAYALLGDCYVNIAHANKDDKAGYDKALASYDKAIKTADGNPELIPAYLVKKANVYNYLKQYDKSLACYEEIKNQYPNYSLGTAGVDFYIEREKALAGK